METKSDLCLQNFLLDVGERVLNVGAWQVQIRTAPERRSGGRPSERLAGLLAGWMGPGTDVFRRHGQTEIPGEGEVAVGGEACMGAGEL
jgi:hypothetical protein